MALYMTRPDLEYVWDRITSIKAFPLPNRRMLKLFDAEYGADR